MSRRRASLQQLSNDCEQNAPIHLADNRVDRDESTILDQLTSWPGRLSSWLNVETIRMFDDKTDEFSKILPSVMSFIFGLVLVKIYGDFFDSAIHNWYGYSKYAFYAICGLFARVTSKDIEVVAVACVLLLFWIGALRILFNLASKFFELPKFSLYNS